MTPIQKLIKDRLDALYRHRESVLELAFRTALVTKKPNEVRFKGWNGTQSVYFIPAGAEA